MESSGSAEDDIRSVEAAELRLRDAALAGDVAALEALLADDLVFVNQLGHVLGKEDDLDLHRTGAFRLETLTFSGYRLRSMGPGLIFAVLRADATGEAGGAPFEATLRFTRLWRRDETGWRVASAQCTSIA
ncbi:nuclear transport factor 2 family protein [Ancylobacter sp.]|uniref:nuclear transport factor 2 family protein n=1 Tax=Ancylobacter sp. TaxID=1872567 RepID=UPI003D120809